MFYEIIEKYGVNVIFTAPTALRMLMRYGEEYPQGYDLRSLRFLTCAGEPLNPEALRWTYEHICGSGEWGHVVDNWWQTETGGPCLGTTATMPVKPGRVGRPLPGAEMDIVDREGQPITEPDKGGLLVIRRPFPHFFRTVFGDPERYSQDWNTIPGVYFTGDVALRDADGYYMVVGRADDVLNVAGHRIGSAEVESALVSHPAVAEAAVIGKPDELRGESIKGFVTLRVGNDPSDDMVSALKLHVRNELGPIAVPGRARIHSHPPQNPLRQNHAPSAKSAGIGLGPRRHHDAGGIGGDQIVSAQRSSYHRMNGEGICPAAQRYARRNRLEFDFDPPKGKHSHGTVYVGGRRTQVQHGEIATGTLMSMFRELDIDKRNF